MILNFIFAFVACGTMLFTSCTNTKSVISSYEIQDLQLLKTYQDEPGLISTINYTQTHMGGAYFQEQLLNPLTALNDLQERQKNIQELLNNQAIAANLTQKLALFAQYEKGISFFASADNMIGSTIINSYYFQNRYLTWLNKYPAGLELGQALHLANLFAPLIEHAVIHFLISEKLHDYLGMCCHHNHCSHHHHDHHHNHGPSTGAVFAYRAYNVAHTLIHLMGLKGLIDLVSEQAQAIKAMQAQLMHVARCLEIAHDIVNIVQEQQLALTHSQSFEQLESLFDQDNSSCSPELQEFLALIQSNTFKGDPSIFSRPGITLRAYALAKTVYPELKEKLSAVALVDFYLAVAHLYQLPQPEKAAWSFAQYDNQPSAHIAIEGFWNPLLPDSQPIDQILTFGLPNPSIAIITGPNKAGKSTSLNALALSVLLGQTLGIVPAKTCIFTPFTTIATGFNMNNRVTAGQSLFSTSLVFAQELLKCANKQHERVFIAVDELFNSTEYQQGSLIAHRFVQALAASMRNNCIALIATHFTNLTELEKEDPKMYKNYKAELVTNRGSCNYILEPGLSNPEAVLQLIEDNDFLKILKD